MYKYVVSQNAFVDVEGNGVVRFVHAGDAVIRETPAGKEKSHILVPVNRVACDLAEGKVDILETDINVLKALAELEELDIESVKNQLEAHKVKVRTNNPETLLQKIMELRHGQPVKKIRAGIDDIDI